MLPGARSIYLVPSPPPSRRPRRLASQVYPVVCKHLRGMPAGARQVTDGANGNPTTRRAFSSSSRNSMPGVRYENPQRGRE